MVYIPAECVSHMLYMHAHRGHYFDYGGYVDKIVQYAAYDTLSTQSMIVAMNLVRTYKKSDGD